MVNCSKSEVDYGANLLIGQREKPFVDDADLKHPYYRTPRPDLLSHPSIPESSIHRRGKLYSQNNINVVGADLEDDKINDSKLATDEPSYVLPSHWSTEYSKQVVTPKPNFQNSNQNNFQFTQNKNNAKPKFPINAGNGQLRKSPILPGINRVTTRRTTVAHRTTSQPNYHETDTEVPVNFKSSFKATTPAFPKSVDFTTEVPVNFKSNFKATTPDFPKSVDFTTEVPVNFKSNFKATTPAFPKVVDFTTPLPPGDEIGLLPPEITAQNEIPTVPQLSLDIEPPKADDSHLKRNQTAEEIPITKPSLFYRPPKFEPDYVSTSHVNEEVPASLIQKPENKDAKIDNSDKNWNILRRRLLIPDYEFPLETVSRPGYDSELDSFQADALAPTST